MGLPMACPGGLANEQEPVPVTTQLRGGAFALRARRPWCLPAEHRELCGLCVEIDDGRHPVLHEFSALNVGPRANGSDLCFRRPVIRFRGTPSYCCRTPSAF